MASVTRPAVDSAAFDAAFRFVPEDLELLKSELATVATMPTPQAQHQLPADLQMAALPSLPRQMSFSELPMIGELPTPSPDGVSAMQAMQAMPAELSLDIMQSFYDTPVSPQSDALDSGNASDTSASFSGNGSPMAYSPEEEEQSLEAAEVSDPPPFSKARPFAKKSRASFLADLTKEERALLREEGVHIPADGTTLTKAEERLVKKVRRKIKNKMSAQESRKKKKEYVDGLEARVEQCTRVNVGLRGKINTLEADNKSLLQQLKELQKQVQRMASGSNASASTCLMLLGLCFSVYLNPAGTVAGAAGGDAASGFAPSSFSSRTLKSMPASLSGTDNSMDTMAWFNTFFKEGDAAASEGRPSPYAPDNSVKGSVMELSDTEAGESEAEDASAARKRKAEQQPEPAANVSARSARLAARIQKRSRPVA